MSDFGFVLEDMELFSEQKINDGTEIDTDDYSDEQFECECPRCGFKFNRKK